MQVARWNEIKQAFATVLEARPEDSARVLDDACRADVQLRHEVESLLAAHAAAGGFIEGGVLVLDARALGGVEQVPSEIGGWRIERELGHGGMGRVYLGRREFAGLEQKAAIKVARMEGSSSELSWRFRREQRTLSVLDHPNIARLIDGGKSAAGHPYFAMEFIDGPAIDEYCFREQLGLRERMQLFQAICAAVDFAHQNLVVHRDIKPSNVLVARDSSGRPQPKLLDFGIAGLLEDTSGAGAPQATRASWLTPDYSSPEQIRGEGITTASDVYSLCVLLYVMLSGRLPYRADPRQRFEFERAVCEEEPLAPSVRIARGEGGEGALPPREAHALEGDLDWVVLLGLSKDPARRYHSAGELREEVERWLAGLPVRARGDSPLYRARKFAARNRALTWALGLLFLTAAAGLSGILWQSHETRLRADRIERINSVLSRILSLPDPDVVGRDVRLAEMLDGVAGTLEETFRDDPETCAFMHGRMGVTYHQLGELAHAEEHLQRSLELDRALFGEDSLEYAEGLHRIGELEYDTNRKEAAESHLTSALAVRRRLLPANHLDIASTENGLGLCFCDSREFDEAEPLLRSALQSRSAAGPGLERECALSHANLGRLLQLRGRSREAEEELRTSIAISERSLGPTHPNIAVACMSLGELLLSQGKFDEAESVERRAVAIRRERLGPDHRDLADALIGLGRILVSRRDLDGAEEQLREAIEVGRRAARKGAESEDLDLLDLAAQELLGNVRRTRLDFAGAETILRRVIESFGGTYGMLAASLASPWRTLGQNLMHQRQYGAAVDAFEHSLAAHAEGAEGRTRFAAHVHGDLAEAWWHVGELDLALTEAQLSQSIREECCQPTDWEIGHGKMILAEILLARGDAPSADDDARAGLEILAQQLRPASSIFVFGQLVRAECALANGCPLDALPLFQACRAPLLSVCGPEHDIYQRAVAGLVTSNSILAHQE